MVRRAAALIETHGLDPAGGAHGRAVAETLAGIAPDPGALAAALLLPALEDRRLDVSTIEKRVGAETARLVASAARIAVLIESAEQLDRAVRRIASVPAVMRASRKR